MLNSLRMCVSFEEVYMSNSSMITLSVCMCYVCILLSTAFSGLV